MPEDEVDVHRLVWSPENFDGDKLLTSAFRREDLSGGSSDYVSVSRTDCLDIEAEIALGESQAKSTNSTELRREQAYSVLFNCGQLRSAKDAEGVCPFNVTSEPIPENMAHCGIRNTTGNKGRAYVNQLRLILVSLASRRRLLSEFVADYSS